MKEYVRRDDLKLRAKYPTLNTRIFEISNERFVIFVENPFGSKDELSKEFEHSIRMVTNPVSLIFECPTDYIDEINPITDDKIADDFAGIGITVDQLYNLVVSKFPFIKKIEINEDSNNVVVIHLAKILNKSNKRRINDFLVSMSGNRIKFEASFDLDDDSPVLNISIDNPVLTILPTASNKIKIEYEERDESFWFDHIAGIYQGCISKDKILGDKPLGNSCYISQLFNNNVNIRNGLLLFDRIYMDLPFNRSVKDFCKSQGIKIDDLFSLCQNGRLVFLTNQPYDRIEFDFLNELFKLNPYSVFSRRALSALVIADLVEINKKTLFSNEFTGLLKKDFLDTLHLPFVTSQRIYDFFTWPKRALRQSLNLLLTESPNKISSIGINRCLELPQSHPKNLEYNFEFGVHAPFVHIASALNAYYFPSWEKDYIPESQSSLLYNVLNLFKCSTLRELDNFKLKFSKDSVPSIKLLEVDTFTPINEIERYSKEFCSQKNFNSLFSYLDSLSETERNEKIRKYNDALPEFQWKEKVYQSILSLGSTFIFDFLSSYFFDTPLISIGAFIELLKFDGKQIFDKNETMKKMFYDMKNSINPNKPMDPQAVKFLSRINPVARLEISK